MPISGSIINVIEGVDTSDATMVAGDLDAPKTGYAGGIKVIGTKVVHGSNNVEVIDLAGTVIPAGSYNGSGIAVLSAAEAEKVIAGNIKSGVTLLGVPGNSNVVDTSSGDAVVTEIKIGKKAWVDGVELTGTRYFWLEDYSKNISAIFKNVALPETVTLNAPNVVSFTDVFQPCTGVKTLNLLLSNSLTSLNAAFKSSSIVTLNLSSSTASVTSFLECFYNIPLVTINGSLDLSAATNVTGAFSASSLVTVVFVPNTIKISIAFTSPNLSSASLVSIANGLLEDASAKTLTMHDTSKTAMNALMGDITGADGAYVFTENPAGDDTLTHFITDHKVWTIA